MTTIKYGFEDGEGGEISDWTAIGGATIGASTDNSKNGCMRVSGRTETYEGPQLSYLMMLSRTNLLCFGMGVYRW